MFLIANVLFKYPANIFTEVILEDKYRIQLNNNFFFIILVVSLAITLYYGLRIVQKHLTRMFKGMLSLIVGIVLVSYFFCLTDGLLNINEYWAYFLIMTIAKILSVISIIISKKIEIIHSMNVSFIGTFYAVRGLAFLMERHTMINFDNRPEIYFTLLIVISMPLLFK